MVNKRLYTGGDMQENYINLGYRPFTNIYGLAADSHDHAGSPCH